jgi:soluble lytic murein transglycosylase-like protein
MSIQSVQTRVTELEGMIAAANGASAAPSYSTSFDAQLSQVQAGTSLTATSASLGSGDTPYSDLIDAAAAKYGIDAAVLRGLIRQESGFNPGAGSPAGAQGLTQLMPATAASLGVADVHDPAQSIDGGAHYLRMQLDRFDGDYTKALAAYNAGPGAVQRYGGVPPYAETRNYVTNVLSYADQYRRQAPSQPLSTTTTQPYSTL